MKSRTTVMSLQENTWVNFLNNMRMMEQLMQEKLKYTKLFFFFLNYNFALWDVSVVCGCH